MSPFADNQFHFANEDLYELMRWTRGSGKNNQRLEITLDRLRGAQLTFYNAWSHDGKALGKTFSTGLIYSFQFARSQAGKGESFVQWSDLLFADIKRGNVKPLRRDEFFAPKRPRLNVPTASSMRSFRNLPDMKCSE